MPFDPQVTSKLTPTDVITPSINTIPHTDEKINTELRRMVWFMIDL